MDSDDDEESREGAKFKELQDALAEANSLIRRHLQQAKDDAEEARQRSALLAKVYECVHGVHALSDMRSAPALWA